MSLTLVIGNKNYSSWSLRPWLFLQYHGIAFDEIRIPLYRDESKARILGYSPAGKVPVLLDGDVTVWDSLAILEYLAERFPQTRGWPEDMAERAWARSLAAEMHSGFTALRTHCGMNCRRQPAPKTLPEAVHADIVRINQIWQQCRSRHAAEGPWLLGRFSILDAMFAPVALRFQRYCLETHAEGQAYINTVLSCAPMQTWIAAGEAESEIIEAFE